ncbi:MAG: TerB family tellurite resistance protein [Proteobacteria bacterium]|nr:TerB family tellurite resistance protein [Pseudomonadota bacterium]
MMNRIKALFNREADENAVGAGKHSHDELHLAAAALLVEAACLDGHYGDAEQAIIDGLLRQRFGLDEAEAQTLHDLAVTEQSEANHLLGFTRIVKDRYSPEERIELIEMAWEVAYADGELHVHEANLLRRLGGLLYVSDRDRGEARKRVLARLASTGP